MTSRELRVEILRFVVVELARRNDFAGHGRLGLVVAEHGHFDLARLGHAASMTILRSNSAAERSMAVLSSAACLAFGNAHARSEVRRLDEDRKSETVDDEAQDRALVALPVALEHDFVVADGQPARGEHQLHRRFVHADGGREHARADVRDVGQLQQPLHGAVLAVGTVQDREDDVESMRWRRPDRSAWSVPG